MIAGCAHATTRMKLALVDYTLKRLPSLFALEEDDTQRSSRLQQLQPAIDLFSKHTKKGRGPCGLLQEAGDDHQ